MNAAMFRPEIVGAVMLGGALGALARYLCQAVVSETLGGGFPWGTLTVNVVGSFLMGVLVGWAAGPASHEFLRAMLLVGFLGAFTTFSTFSMDTVRLFEMGAAVAALSYVLANVLLCTVLCVAGLLLGRQL